MAPVVYSWNSHLHEKDERNIFFLARRKKKENVSEIPFVIAFPPPFARGASAVQSPRLLVQQEKSASAESSQKFHSIFYFVSAAFFKSSINMHVDIYITRTTAKHNLRRSTAGCSRKGNQGNPNQKQLRQVALASWNVRPLPFLFLVRF